MRSNSGWREKLKSKFDRVKQKYRSRSPLSMQAPSDHWGRRALDLETGVAITAWTDHPLVNEMYIHPLVSGKADVGWLEAVAGKYFQQPVAKALSLGCGGGGLERHGIQLNIAKHFDAFDASEGSIDVATEIARKYGILDRVNYSVADLNTHTFQTDNYDTVFASQSLHHISNLEHYLPQVANTLKANGLFIINEFVGANQYQWPNKQLEYANSLLQSIPEQYRVGIRHGILKNHIERPTIEHMNNVDPTEGIRSAEILSEMQKWFQIVEKRDFGGTLLQLILEDIAGNFIDTIESRSILQHLMDEEQRLIREGEIESDFTLVIAKAKVS